MLSPLSNTFVIWWLDSSTRPSLPVGSASGAWSARKMRNSWAEGPALATVKSTRPLLTAGGVAWIEKSFSTTAMFGTALAAVTDFVRALRPMATTEVIRAITDSTVAIPGLARRVSGGGAAWRAAGACSVMVANLLVGWEVGWEV